MGNKKAAKKKGAGQKKAANNAAKADGDLALGALSLADKKEEGSIKSWTDHLPAAPPGKEPEYVYSPAGQKVTQFQLDNVGPVNIDFTGLSEDDIPDILCCPITQEILRDPVVADDGYTYEREGILDWFLEHNTSPMTSVELTNKLLIPNKLLRDVLELLYGPKAAAITDGTLPAKVSEGGADAEGEKAAVKEAMAPAVNGTSTAEKKAVAAAISNPAMISATNSTAAADKKAVVAAIGTPE